MRSSTLVRRLLFLLAPPLSTADPPGVLAGRLPCRWKSRPRTDDVIGSGMKLVPPPVATKTKARANYETTKELFRQRAGPGTIPDLPARDLEPELRP